ncbi:MAG: bacterioferritin [Bdellovibrionales bacterium]|nr:bacterioferritin [Bdellovibrionales bacterium]
MAKSKKEDRKLFELLNKALEHEYSGVIRYSHYSLMIFGFNRIPIVKWFREQSAESLIHAEKIGEWITTLGGHPSLKISDLLETHKHDVKDILKESLDHENEQLALLEEILDCLDKKQIALEEFVRKLIEDETLHISEIEKMLRSQR